MEFLTDPVAWWIEPFEAGFMRSALLAGLLAVVATSLVGTWVVLQNMSFLGDALAHGVLPGIAIAFVVGANTGAGAFVAALAMVGGVTLLRNSSPLPEDTSIGVLFVGFLALAVVIMSTGAASYAGDLNRFLFGSITAIDNADLVRQALAALACLIGVTVMHRTFITMTFDEVQSQLLGMRPKLGNAVLLVLVAVAVVATFETVGNLLVFAFLIAPPATASMIARRVPYVMMAAVGLGAIAVIVGLLVSYNHGTAASATMALAAVVEFLVVALVRSLRTVQFSGARSQPGVVPPAI